MTATAPELGQSVWQDGLATFEELLRIWELSGPLSDSLEPTSASLREAAASLERMGRADLSERFVALAADGRITERRLLQTLLLSGSGSDEGALLS